MIARIPKPHLLILLYVTFLSTPVGLIFNFSRANLDIATAYNVGQVFGVLGLSMLSLQLLLASRASFLDKGVGLDRIMRWHKFNAKLLTVFLITHPVLVLSPFWYNRIDLTGLLNSLSIAHYLGAAALVLLITNILLTVYSRELKINYEHWKVIHKIGYLIVGLGFAHSFMIGSDIYFGGAVFYWWVFVCLITVFAIFYRYVYRPFKFRNYWYRVDQIVQETHDVRTIVLKPIYGKVFDFVPGQFAFVRFFSDKISDEDHHFTISSAPNPNHFTFTIKESGDYTSTLGNLVAGDKAKVEGPYGMLVPSKNHLATGKGSIGDAPTPLVFIAGGIGITPIHSSIEYLKKQPDPAQTLLIYANKTQRDIVFKEELDQLANTKDWFRVVHVLSEEYVEGIDHGYVDQNLLRREIPDFQKANFFVVGPRAMMEKVIADLKKLRVEPNRLFSERFALR